MPQPLNVLNINQFINIWKLFDEKNNRKYVQLEIHSIYSGQSLYISFKIFEI